jgi:predicted nucleotide-binding protein
MLDMAAAIKMSPSSSSYKRLLASSFRYGLTEGSPQTKIISLTTLGRSIVGPTVNDDPNASLRKALIHSDIFNKFYSMFNDKPIPREEILKNTLANPVESGGFGIIRGDVPDFLRVATQNIKDYSLGQDISGTSYLRLNKLSAKTDVITPQIESETENDDLLSDDKLHHELSEEIQKEEQKQIPKVFISHSKNENILQQLKTILEFGTFEYKIAEEEETAAIPVPDKVFGLMRQCNCAIINVSADEEMKKEDGKYRINENVLIEIGAAFVHYDKRVILLVDKRIELPSNLQGLYKCEYEGDELSFMVAMKLQRALTDFRKSI